MRPRTLVHRLGAVLCGLLLLQLALLAPAACTSPPQRGTHAMSAMWHGHDAASGAGDRCGPPMATGPCTPAACAIATMTDATGLPVLGARRPVPQIVDEPNVLAIGTATAPELPPPRG